MKRFASIALAFLVFAAVPLAETYLQLYGHYAVPEGANFTIEDFSFQGTPAYAIVSGGEPYGIFVRSSPQPRAVTGEKELQSALYSYYVSEGYSPRPISELGTIHGGIKNASTAYLDGEAKCRVLTGTDRYECHDFDSCLLACYSVTSFCQPIALAVGKPFINEIWKFENSSSTLGGAYGIESQAFENLSSNASDYNVRFYLYSIDRVAWAAQTAASSQLYYGYSYCFQPDYSLDTITKLKRAAHDYYSSASPFLKFASETSLVQGRTLAAMGKMGPNKTSDAQNNRSEDAPKLADTMVNSEPSSGQPLPLLALIGAIGIVAIGAAAYVVLIRKKRGL